MQIERLSMMKIIPDFIPHEQFHLGTWLIPDSDPAWYYFMEKQNLHKIRNRKFNSSVDLPLRELVKFLHKRNIITSPSCSGHDMSADGFREIYEALSKQKYQIRNGGLILTDIESGEKIMFNDHFYDLPWTLPGYIDKGLNYQMNGIIGMEIRDVSLIRQLLIQKWPGVVTSYKDGLLMISMKPHLNLSNDERWEVITQNIKDIFLQHYKS